MCTHWRTVAKFGKEVERTCIDRGKLIRPGNNWFYIPAEVFEVMIEPSKETSIEYDVGGIV